MASHRDIQAKVKILQTDSLETIAETVIGLEEEIARLQAEIDDLKEPHP